MKFKEFVRWRNERACDGRWGMEEAIACIDRLERVRCFKFWRREREWQRLNQDSDIVVTIIEPTNKKIKEFERMTQKGDDS